MFPSIPNDPVFDAIQGELARQNEGIELIASENFTSPAVKRAVSSCLTNKYAEGLPGKRYYGGCQWVDEVESLAIARACELFGAEWANVQPHSGAQANAAVMLALLKPGDTIMGFDLAHGGHLTHGSPANSSGKLYRAVFYGVEKDSSRINYDDVQAVAEKEKPRLIICGASAYSRDWNYKRFRQIADAVGAVLLADIAHPAGLIAADQLQDPIPHCHIVSSTTHKTLRGPRGGLLMVGKDIENPLGITDKKGNLRKLGSLLDSAVFPGIQGGPLPQVIAGKAVAFGEALHPSFKDYARQVIQNARALAVALIYRDFNIVSGGTDNHLLLVDLRPKNLTGKEAEEALVKADITVNKNLIPYDEKGPNTTSGIRLGTAALTTRGLKEKHMEVVAELIDQVLRAPNDERNLLKVKTQVHHLMRDFALPYSI